MAKHHPDLIMCRKQPGIAIGSIILSLKFCFPGRLCEKCDGKCVICDSYVRPCSLVKICDECNYGSYQGRCTICGGPGISLKLYFFIYFNKAMRIIVRNVYRWKKIGMGVQKL